MTSRAEFREAMRDAIFDTGWFLGDKVEVIIEEIFADVAAILRRQTGAKFCELDLLLADEKADAFVKAKDRLDGLVEAGAAAEAAIDTLDDFFAALREFEIAG
jgi:hypothetical protein